MILFGMGQLGRTLLPQLKPRAACDNNPALWGKTVDGVDVLSPHEAFCLYPDDEFVVSIYNGSSVRDQITKAGRKPVHFMEYMGREAVDRANVAELRPLLDDDESRIELDQQVSGSVLTEHYPPEEIYFPEYFTPRQDEVFVDCGAFDGDSIRAFKKWAKQWKAIYALEPISTVKEDAVVLPFAVGNENKFVRFSVAGPGSKESPNGQMVQVVRLDDVFRDEPPTFIKMDIEGAEPDAIRGAARILRKHKPKLAICLYHERRHLWEIPLLVKSINPDYKLRIRRYAEDCWETVLYAF